MHLLDCVQYLKQLNNTLQMELVHIWNKGGKVNIYVISSWNPDHREMWPLTFAWLLTLIQEPMVFPQIYLTRVT